MKTRAFHSLALTTALVALGCDDAAQPAMPADAAQPDMTTAAACDASRPPLVMAHGLLASGDTWSAHVRRFIANGECADRFYAFDWNTLDRGADHAAALDALIDRVRAAHQVDRVDLMGHSAGGGLGVGYLDDPARAAKVRRYVHVGSVSLDAPVGPDATPVDTLNLWSRGDTVVPGEDSSAAGITNVALDAEDHYAVATSAASFRALYGFLRDGAPPSTEDPTGLSGADGRVDISGRAVVLGDNAAEVGAQVQVWPVDTVTGARVGEAPAATFAIGEDGAFGPFEASTATRYAFFVTSPRAGARPVRYDYSAFQTDDRLVYLRTLPTAGLGGALLGQIPFADTHGVFVVYLARGAMLAGRDTLTINGENVATEEVAAADDTTIALFVYDAGADAMDGGSIATFDGFPFLAGLDRFFAPAPSATLDVTFNGVSLGVPRHASGTDGATIIVFE